MDTDVFHASAQTAKKRRHTDGRRNACKGDGRRLRPPGRRTRAAEAAVCRRRQACEQSRTTPVGKDGGRTEHEEKVWKVRARPRTRGGRDRRQTKAADENGNRRDGNRTAPHLTRRALLTPTPPMGAHSALASALPPLRPHAPCMCASARAPVLVRNGERTRATWGLRG